VNCESEICGSTRTEIDVALGRFGLEKFNEPARARECWEQRLQEVTKQICQSKEDLYTQSQRYRNYDQRYERIQSGVNRIEELHLRHQQWLLDQADQFYERADGHGDSSLAGREYRAYGDIFETESHHRCFYGDQYRRGGFYNR